MLDGTFPKSVGFVSHIHLEKGPQRAFGRKRSSLKNL